MVFSPPITSGWYINSKFYRAALRREGIGDNHPIHYLAPFFHPSKSNNGIVTVHDMYFKHGVEPNGFTAKLTRKFKNWNNIISISEATKRDMVEDGFSEDAISVIHHGVPDFWQRLQEAEVLDYRKKLLNIYGIRDKKPLVLTIGDGHTKNNQLAFESVKDEFIHVHVGKSPAHINMSSVSNEELLKLYNAADVYLRPATYEGFGIPAIESFKCGTPAVVSNISVYHETLGDSGIYVELNSESIIRGVKKALSEEENLVAAFDKERAEHFSMERFSHDMREYYRRVAS